MRRALQVLAITMLVLGTAGMAYAQTPPPEQQSQATQVTGTVVSVSDQMLVVRTDDGELNLTITSATEQPDQQLQVGERVRVWHREDATTGEQIVTRVTRVDDASAMQNPQQSRDQSTQARDQSRDQARDQSRDAASQRNRNRDEMAQQDSLPRTAGSSPLLAVLGATALIGAAGLHYAGRLF